MITIRRASNDDIPAMQNVRQSVRENRLDDPDSVQPRHYRALLDEQGRGWVAEMESRVVGFAVADLTHRSVWALFVHPEFERRGIGRQLHDVMLAWFFDAGADTVRLTTSPGTRAERFYVAAGWRHGGPGAHGEVVYEISRDRRCAPSSISKR